MSERKKETPAGLYGDRLPEDILKELTPEARRQYFLWDEIMKREIQLYPHLILPVAKEIFHKEYPGDRNIILLSTEYTVDRVCGVGEKLLGSIRSDILMKIEGDLYHFECQIKKDGKMVFRMFEYDVNIAAAHGKTAEEGKESEEKFMISFPKSAVLYLGNEKSVPEYEACGIRFPDGTKHLYRVPVMRVQEYDLREIEEKHLAVLIPFLPIRFKERIKRAAKKAAERETVRRDMAEFLSGCLAVLGREREKAVITEMAGKDIGEFLWKACGYLLEEDKELYEMIRVELEPAIKLSREIIQELRKDMEDSYRRLIEKLESEGKSAEETEDDLMAVFALPRETAREKIRLYRKEN